VSNLVDNFLVTVKKQDPPGKGYPGRSYEK